jgi:hypothetical protein
MGEGDDGELAGRIVSEEGETLLAGDRGGVDDLAAAALRAHLLRALLDADQNPEAVDAHDLVELVLGDVHHVLRLRDARVVEQHVEAPELADGGRNRVADAGAVGDVASDADRLAAGTGDLACDRVGSFLIEVGDRYGGALRAQAEGDPAADPATGSRDHATVSVEPSHSVPFARRSCGGVFTPARRGP